ncbi:putative cytochrome P450 hydroxylase [Cystobacter fuscus DSM 2262]|uniref:Cytochrome P450 hydroxylase n=1 Tax=Cystobacter fuscus (strain ATCC 25194 / DSM 2262 / NBRC 100088 / M29) TaxID=1242864 RepID=S9QKI4_CYSF2|nr:cytochrome P450 [Cystobacter fuscus]EPX56993.1 putative cytochrome P450 hydroxylase [Cystobacter fuscus DSM 2262]
MQHATQQQPSTFDFLSLEAARNPHPMYHELRAQQPILWSPQLNGWVLTRHADIAQVLKDPRLVAGPMTGQFERLPEEVRTQLTRLRDAVNMWMGHTTNEGHLRFQALLKRYFTPRTVENFRPRIQALTDTLLDTAAARGSFDMVKELAIPLPANVIADMLGVPLTDEHLLQRWSRDLAAIFSNFHPEQLFHSQKSILEMMDYMREVLSKYRRGSGENILEVFLRAQDEGLVSEEEILANCALLLFAGHETTARLISRGLALLFDHPEQLALLRQQPSLIPQAVEEMLRYGDVAGMTNRLTVAPVELGGQTMQPYQMVYVMLAAANRDPALFPEPDRFDITRKPGKHVAFGYGSFYCLGAALARLEAQVFFETLLRRFPNVRPAKDASPEWKQEGLLNMHLVTLPVEL